MQHRIFKTAEDVVASNLCLHCGTCIAACPAHCIEKSVDRSGNPVPKIRDSCVECGVCVDVCPGIKVTLSPAHNDSTSKSQYLGCFNGTFVGKAGSGIQIKRKTASGGVVSAIADTFFSAYPNGLVQWVRLSSKGETTASLLNHEEFEKVDGDSIYIPSFANQAFFGNEKGDSRPIIAIGLPCQIQGLRLLEKHDRGLSERIVCRISLFCGLSISTNALPFLLGRSGHSLADVAHIRFRTKKGLVVTLKSGNEMVLNKNSVNYSHMVRRCALCPDHTGELADISCGDAWLSSFSKKAESPWSVIIARSDAGNHWVRRAVEGKRLWAMRIDVEDVIASQRPMLFFKKRTLGQRYFVNKALGGLNPQYNGPRLEKSASLRILVGNLVLLGHLRWRNCKLYMFFLTRGFGLSPFNQFIKFCLYLDVGFFVHSLAGYWSILRYRTSVLPYQLRWFRKAKRRFNDKFQKSMGGAFFPRFSDEILAEWRSRFPESAKKIIASADRYVKGIYNVFDIAYDLKKYGWRRSPETGAKYPNMVEPILGFWFRKSRSFKVFGDEKYAIELHKHYTFVALALAFRLTGNKEYADVLGEGLKSWRTSALPHMGIAWYGNIHVTQRMLAWLFSYLLFGGTVSEGDDIRTEIANGLLECTAVLSARYMYPANNHKIGSLCGLVIGLLFRNKRSGRDLLRYLDALSFELKRQITSNGAPLEGSIAYGRFVLEFLLVLKFFAGSSGFELPDSIVSRSRAMVQWFTNLCGPESQPPAIGDKSGEMAFPFSEGLWSFGDTLALGQRLFGLSVTRRLGPFSWLLLRAAGIDEPPPVEIADEVGSCFIDRESGYARLTSPGKMGTMSVWMRSGKFGLPPKFGHAHSDFLAPVVCLDGTPILTECGTYKYNVHTESRLKDVLSQGHSGIRYDLFEQASWGGTFEWTRNGITAGWKSVRDGLSAWMKMPDEALLTRTIRLDEDGLVIKDSLKMDDIGERLMEWSFIFDAFVLEDKLKQEGSAIFRSRCAPERFIYFSCDGTPSDWFKLCPIRISTSYGRCHSGWQICVRRLVHQSGIWVTRLHVKGS